MSCDNSFQCKKNDTSVCVTWKFIKPTGSNNGAYLPAVTVCANQYFPPIEVGVVPTVTTDDLSVSWNNDFYMEATVTDIGTVPVTERGFVWATSANPTISDNKLVVGSGVGSYSGHLTDLPNGDTVYVKAYATNSVGTGYGNELTGVPQYTPCLMKGTKVTLFNLVQKNIEDIEYNNHLLVWDFDEGRYTNANPVWISTPSVVDSYCLAKFSDGSELKSVLPHLGHRIFNIDLGKFTYPMETEIGTRTFNVEGAEVTLVSKEIVNEQGEFYNIVTNKHINLFANGILTSARLNNIYPIENMKFVKDNRELKDVTEFSEYPAALVEGFRLIEQPFSIEEIKSYVNDKLLKMVTN